MAGGRSGRADPRAAFIKACRDDINLYFGLLGFKPTFQQKQLVDDFQAGHSNIAVRSGKGPGKTTITSILIPYWNLTVPDSVSVVTAPTMDQCRNVWLAEAQRWIINGDPRIRSFFKFTGGGYGIAGNPAKLWGCRLRTANKPENLQGIHRENLLIYMEEASGLTRPIMQAIQDTLSGNKDAAKYGGQNRCLAVGNPNTRTCRFFDFFHSLADNPWKCLHWNAEETPDSSWFSKDRNIEIAEEWGNDSDIYKVAVLGEFPSSDPDSLISEDDIIKCFTREAYSKAMQIQDNDKQFGIDLARMGGDENAVIARQGGLLLHSWFRERIDPNTAIDHAVLQQDSLNWGSASCMYTVDTSGMGETAVGRIGSAKRMGKRVHEFYSNNKAYESSKYHDKITEAWCSFAKRVRKHEVYLGDRQDKKMVFQLTNRKYHVTDKGKIKIESKDEYKKRNADIEGGELGKSPDRADALVMAFYPYAFQSMRVVTA